MVDFRRFLASAELIVLPHFGGLTLEAKERRLRLRQSCEPGWWRFCVEGRYAEALGPAEPEGLELLPVVRGHYTRGRLVQEGANAEPLWFLPEEPPRFAFLRARRWPTGALIYDGPELEGDAEEQVRRLYQERKGSAQGASGAPRGVDGLGPAGNPVSQDLAGLSGVPSSLRAAFLYTALFDEAEARSLVVSILELRRAFSLTDAERTRFWTHLSAERARAQREQQQQAQLSLARVRADAIQAARLRGGRSERDEVQAALEKSGAQLLDLRTLQDHQLEVIFRVDGERFQAVVWADTLQVLDAGICLSGHDAALTLESLPGVIREAIQDDVLVITRH